MARLDAEEGEARRPREAHRVPADVAVRAVVLDAAVLVVADGTVGERQGAEVLGAGKAWDGDGGGIRVSGASLKLIGFVCAGTS